MNGPDDLLTAADGDFYRRYGPWVRHTPVSAAALYEGFPAPWWISGGWAIEAFTGSAREHEDIDVTIFRRDVRLLRQHFAGRFDLWAVGSGLLHALTEDEARHPRWSGQVWMREHALAPWQLDIVLNPGTYARWVFKRDHSITRRFEDATWIASDGLRYTRPELVLAHKVRQDRPKDRVDLAAAWPLLDPTARKWLVSYVANVDSAHPWLDLLV